MKQRIGRWVIKAFGQLLAPASRRFYAALQQPQQSQEAVQRRLVARLRDCKYGRQYGVCSYADWQRLPIVDYDDLEPWIVATQAKQSLLTPEPILFYEPTSGSRRAVKRIPYTRELRRSFNHMFCVWAYDLIAHGPKFCTGKFYFSTSPSFTESATAGTTDDADYLDPWLRWLLKPFLVIAPPSKTPNEFKENLAKTLLKAEDLEIISVWSPSFLTVVLDYIQQHNARLSEAIRGEISAPRLSVLQQNEICWRQLWPELKFISCWDSAAAADSAVGVRSRFPNVLVQGKGLLATEAPITLPILAAQGQVPLLDEVFFEFEAEDRRVFELHQLEAGKTYGVIVSQMGGLTRYRMGDRVQVTHFFKQTPCLKFMGRGVEVSDMVGEKLNLQFVSSLLERIDIREARFKSLVPVQRPSPHYVLFLDCTREAIDELTQTLDSELCESFHYRLARQLGQLAPARIIVAADIAEQLAKARAKQGQRWGDIKHPLLHTVSLSSWAKDSD